MYLASSLQYNLGDELYRVRQVCEASAAAALAKHVMRPNKEGSRVRERGSQPSTYSIERSGACHGSYFRIVEDEVICTTTQWHHGCLRDVFVCLEICVICAYNVLHLSLFFCLTVCLIIATGP